LSQGVVKLWVEINPVSLKPEDVPLWDIAPRPPQELEVRICVFNATDIKMMDWEGTSDVFFRGFIDSKEDVQETDTHFRNQDGKPDFQYRLIYRIKVPRKDYKFTLQAYDRDIFKSNDIIGEASINLRDIIEDTTLVKKPLGLNKKYFNDVLEPKKF
jgi:Ca2+-dependent lipid-binding protein